MRMVPIMDQKFTLYAGNPECRYVPTYLRYQLDLAASYVALRFPELQDIRLWIGSGQSIANSCPGHDAHLGHAVDINYYTKNINSPETPNATQYRPYNAIGMQCAQIWDGDIFLPDKFHFDANYMLFRILSELGITQYRTSELIRQEYMKRGYDVTGMVGDFMFTYNHHIHAHLEFRPPVDRATFESHWNNKKKLTVIEVSKRGRLKNDPMERPETFPVCLFVTPNDPVIVNKIKEAGLILDNSSYCDVHALKLYELAQRGFSYYSDNELYGTEEYWEFPWELRQKTGGDCDGWANNIASYLIAGGIPSWRVAVATGKTTQNLGHAVVYYLRDDMSSWCLLDSISSVPSNVLSIKDPIFPVYGTTEHNKHGSALKTFDICYNDKQSWWGNWML